MEYYEMERQSREPYNDYPERFQKIGYPADEHYAEPRLTYDQY